MRILEEPQILNQHEIFFHKKTVIRLQQLPSPANNPPPPPPPTPPPSAPNPSPLSLVTAELHVTELKFK